MIMLHHERDIYNIRLNYRQKFKAQSLSLLSTASAAPGYVVSEARERKTAIINDYNNAYGQVQL